MNICDRTHDEIVFTTRKCPLCIAEERIKQLEEEVAGF